MAKVKFNTKDFLLRRGEVLAMGAAGFFLLILLIWGATKWTSAMDPDKESKELIRKADAVNQKINTGEASDEDKKPLALPPWMVTKSDLRYAKASDFPMGTSLFDTTGTPNTKRENPIVLPIGEHQVDLVKGAFTGYDIIYDEEGEPLIAVLSKKVESKYDANKLKEAHQLLTNAAKRGQAARDKLKKQDPKNNNQPGTGPGGTGPGTGPGGPVTTPGGPSRPGMGGFPSGIGGSFGGMGGYGSPHGLQGNEYDQQAQRHETAIKYISLKEIDASVRDGKLPALTVIPTRMVVVHAVVPYTKQLEEFKRALRLPNPPANAKPEDIAKSNAEARRWGPWYDGFEVQRRITKVLPDGSIKVIQDWPAPTRDPQDTSGNYKFEEEYIARIDTKKIATHFDEGYIPYFLKPELMLAMPMPQLTKELNVKYPEVTLKAIVDNIEKLKKLNQKEVTQSELAKQVSGSKPSRDIYKPQTADALSGLGYDDTKKFGPTGFPGGTAPPGGPPVPGTGGPGPIGGVGAPKPPTGYGDTGQATPNDVDNYLLRFVDSDVRPGWTYEYRIRLRMWNPNFEQDKLVANPEYAKESYHLLKSKWIQLATVVTVPAESFLYAHDVKTYRDQINTTYPAEGKEATAETKALNKLFQVRDDQAVVEIATWMEQVKAGSSKREPVGAWVVAEIPVGRGEFIGRRQYVKLPLWSSETQQYTLREVPETAAVKRKFLPKGWLVDFSTTSVLVDFDGGKVKTKSSYRFDDKGNLVAGTRNIEEDVGTELLIVRPDGKLVVRNSLVDDADPDRKAISTEWARWLKEVENHKSSGGGSGEPNPFDPKK
jgi:hypothetical protein